MRILASLLLLFAVLVQLGCGGDSSSSRSRSRSRSSRSEARSERSSEDARATGKVVLSSMKEEGGDLSLTLNGVLAVNGVKIRSGQDGDFLAFPRRRDQDEDRWWNYIRVNRGDADNLLEAAKDRSFSSSPQGFEISSTTVKLIDGTGRRKAFVEFELEDGAVVLYSWALVEGQSGLFLSGPSEKVGNEWKDIIFPVNAEFRRALSEAAVAY